MGPFGAPRWTVKPTESSTAEEQEMTTEWQPQWEKLTDTTYVTADWSMTIEKRGNVWWLKDNGRSVKSFRNVTEAKAWERDWRAGKVRI